MSTLAATQYPFGLEPGRAATSAELAALRELPDCESYESPEPNASSEGWSALAGFVRQRLVAGSNQVSGEARRELDRVLLPAVLEFAEWNRRLAASVLGISRQTLRQRLRAIGLLSHGPATERDLIKADW